VGLTLLVAVLLCSWTWRRVGAQRQMQIVNIPNSNLQLIGADDLEFENFTGKLLANQPVPEFAILKPFSVVLINHSGKAVVYSVRWEFTKATGERIHVDYSDAQIRRMLDGDKKRTDASEDLVDLGY
jgi:hypothetical protein